LLSYFSKLGAIYFFAQGEIIEILSFPSPKIILTRSFFGELELWVSASQDLLLEQDMARLDIGARASTDGNSFKILTQVMSIPAQEF
jgi:hypothetical protein